MKNYYCNEKRYFEQISEYDSDLIKKINEFKSNYWYPTDKVIEGVKTNDAIRIGRTNVHHFFTKRNL